jgi:hypothetical protein
MDDALQAGVGGDAKVESGHCCTRFATAEKVDGELPLLFEQARAAGIADASGTRDDDLEAASVEDDPLPPVDSPAVERGGSAFEWAHDQFRLELEVVAAGIGQEVAGA